jgi:hypothetical protein
MNDDNGYDYEADRTSKQVMIEFDRSLLQHFNVSSWNEFVEALVRRELVPTVWGPGERPPPVGIMFNFRRLKRRHYVLDGIDLSLCSLDNADFEGASLKGAQLGCGRNVCYRNVRMDAGTDFRNIEITGCDFTGAIGLELALWDGAVYDEGNPPIGLPTEVLSRCKAEPPEPVAPQKPNDPDDDEPLDPCNPVPRAPFNECSLNACACVTISEMPW